MYKRWAGLGLMLLAVWMLLPGAQASNNVDGFLPNLTGHTTIGIETIGPSSPPDWYDFTVTVQDEEGNLLEGVVIRLHPVLSDGTLGAAITGTDGRYMTDENGQQKYRIPPPGGEYQLQTEFAGYEHYTSVRFQITSHGSMVVTLRKLPDGAVKPPKTGDQCYLHWYILLCMAVSMAGGMGRLWYLSRIRCKDADQAVEPEETGEEP